MFVSDTLILLVFEKCIKVTAMLLGRYDFIDLSHPYHEYWCPFEKFVCEFEDIFVKELLELSILARSYLDVDDIHKAKRKDLELIIVGSLFQNGGDKHLNFRQACNKIIHSKKCEVKLDWSDRHPLDNGKNGYSDSDIRNFKDPIIELEGELTSGEEWKVEIHFLKYIEVVLYEF